MPLEAEPPDHTPGPQLRDHTPGPRSPVSLLWTLPPSVTIMHFTWYFFLYISGSSVRYKTLGVSLV